MIAKSCSNKGLFFGILSGLCFTLMAFGVKKLSNELPLPEILFCRGLLNIILLFPFLYLNQNIKFFDINQKIVWYRSLVGFFSVSFYYYTLKEIGVSKATLLADTSPLFLLFFSFIFLKEKLTKKEFLFLAFILIGNYLFYFEGKLDLNLRGHGLGLMTALLMAFSHLLLKMSTKVSSPYQIVWIYSFMIFCFSWMIPSSSWILPNDSQLYYLFFIGIMGLLAQIFLSLSFQSLKSSLASIVSLSGVLWAVLIEVFVYFKPMSISMGWAYFLILIGLMGIQFQKKK